MNQTTGARVEFGRATRAPDLRVPSQTGWTPTTDRLWLVLLVAIVLLHGPPAGAESHLVSIGLTSHGFAGVRMSYEYSLTSQVRVGGFWQGSALMMVQGDFDTGELGLTAGLRRDIGGPWFADGSVAAGYRYQSQSLGRARSLFCSATGRIGGARERASAAVELGWEQTFLTSLRYSEFVKQTFEDRYDGGAEAPAGTRRVFPAGRCKAGVASTFRVAARNRVDLAGGILWTPNPFVSGFGGMMFGLFPFYADLGVRVSR